MKYPIILILAIFFVFTMQSCKDDCEMSTDPICQETPPTDEDCQAAFERWFYVEDSNECAQISYSGCSQKGFDSKEACEACGCN